VVARTKADLERGAVAPVAAPEGSCGAVRVSALRGDGLAELRALLPRLAYRGLIAAEVDAPVLTRARHARAMTAALEEVRAFARALRDGVGPEVAAAHLKPAEGALEELLGVITPDDVLDRVFSDFCVGK
jgi:tRNA modification GTPase